LKGNSREETGKKKDENENPLVGFTQYSPYLVVDLEYFKDWGSFLGISWSKFSRRF